MTLDKIVEGTDIGSPSDTTDLLPILWFRITARLIVDEKGKRSLDKNKGFTTYLQD